MSFRKVELTAVVCDSCDACGIPHPMPAEAERLATTGAVPITRLSLPGKHACAKCRAAIAKGEAKR